MNADILLAHYDRIADAPDAVARLRRFVLDLAVRGKLVPQEEGDEPASELLAAVVAEKAKLVRIGEISRSKALPRVSDVEKTFQLPRSWVWVRLCELCALVTSGSRDWAQYYADDGAIFIRMGNLSKGHYRLRLDNVQHVKPPKDGEGTRTRLAGGDILISITGDVGMLGLVPDDFGEAYTNQHTALARPLSTMKGRYLAEFFRSTYAQQQFDAPQRGIKNSFRLTDIAELVVPLPPVAEQRRIVGKVDELMALCDQLEVARTTREATRDRMAAASLARLNTRDPETFPADARFALNTLPALTARPDQVKQLRQCILNLGVRGLLLPQDDEDEPASELIKRTPAPASPARIDSRSRELIPGNCGLSINSPGTKLPVGWEWVPLTRIARLESGHTPSRSRPDWWGGDVPWIGLVDARNHNNSTIYQTLQTTNAEGIANSSARILPTGTVCFSRTASVGYVVVMGRPMSTSQDFVNWVPTSAITSDWMQMVMIAERPAIERFSKGAIHQTIYYPAWLSMHIALPPLAEQRRIVAKVNELMALCDQLEASLAAASTARARLLEATLHAALVPAGSLPSAAE